MAKVRITHRQLAYRAILAEWPLHTGFLGMLRDGHFDRRAYERMMDVVRSIDIGRPDFVNRQPANALRVITSYVNNMRNLVEPEREPDLYVAISEAQVVLDGIPGTYIDNLPFSSSPPYLESGRE